MPKFLIILFFVFYLVSCSRVSIVNNSKRSVTFNSRQGHGDKVDILINKNFYLWGKLPKEHHIDVGEILKDKGQKSASSLTVKKENYIGSYIWPLVTFGFYIPKYYRIKYDARY